MQDPSIAQMRRDYASADLLEAAVDADPIVQFERWFAEARAAEVFEPNAMILATVGDDGQPSARVVLLKGVDQRGLVFFTNLDSRKGQQLRANGQGALCFWWAQVARQVRFEGLIGPVAAAEADPYFASRPRGSQLGAWASPQSEVIASREALAAAEAEQHRRFGDGPIPRPPFWGGYRLRPARVEFWQGQTNRLHDRLCYQREGDGPWRLDRLGP